MFFDVVSDANITADTLHLAIANLPKLSPTLILSGDIAPTASFEEWTIFSSYIAVCCTSYLEVIFVPGNHEYYCATEKVTMTNLFYRICKLSTIHKNFKVLDGQTIVNSHEKLVVYGATLWSNIDELSFKSNLPIYIKLGDSPVNITHSFWMKNHYSARQGLEDAIETAKQNNYKLLVVTHYSPLVEHSLDPKYHGSKGNEMYCTDLSKYFGDVDMWVYGHTGFNGDITINKCTFYSNQAATKSGRSYEKRSISI
jgi:hypothetical protein